MRAELVEAVLDRELEVCLSDPAINTPGITVWREGLAVYVGFEAGRDTKPGLFLLDCESFDAQPPSVIMVDPQTRAPLPHECWTPGVPHSVHPTLNRPFVCIQGVREYHLHPSHLDDSWDRYRRTIRLPQTIQALLAKAGARRP